MKIAAAARANERVVRSARTSASFSSATSAGKCRRAIEMNVDLMNWNGPSADDRGLAAASAGFTM